MFIKKTKLIQQLTLAESIAGDTPLGHGIPYVNTIESMAGISNSDRLSIERTLALEMERIAIHVGDLSGMAVDIAYQLAADVINVLRTPVINWMQLWCGNRFGKGLLGVGGTHYPLTERLCDDLEKILQNFEGRFATIMERLFSSSGVLSRFRKIGVVTGTQSELIGSVGMLSRITGIDRDIRKTHPFEYYQKEEYDFFTIVTGIENCQ